jgi:hypothetical protein
MYIGKHKMISLMGEEIKLNSELRQRSNLAKLGVTTPAVQGEPKFGCEHV